MLSKKDFDIAYCVQRIQICLRCVCVCIYALWLLFSARVGYALIEALCTEHPCVLLFNAVGETPFALTNDCGLFSTETFLDSLS